MSNLYAHTFDEPSPDDDAHQRHHHHVHDPNLSSVARYSPTGRRAGGDVLNANIAAICAEQILLAPNDDETVTGDRDNDDVDGDSSVPLRRRHTSRSVVVGDDDTDVGQRPATGVDLQQLMPTVEDAELLYGFGLYGSAFRYDYGGDSLDVSLMPSAGIRGSSDDVDDASDMLTTLLDHRTAAVDGGGDHQEKPIAECDTQQHQQMQQRTLLELAMMPLLAAVNDITARDELFQPHQLDANITCPGTHPASDLMLMDGQLSSVAGELMSAAALDITAINGFLDVDRSLSDDDARFAALSAALDSAVNAQTAAAPTTATTSAEADDPEAIDELTVADSHVPSRAWASLPVSHLFIAQTPPNDEFSVFASRPIAVRTKFGPLEGDLRSLLSAEMELMRSDSHRRLPVLFVNDSQLVDVSNEYTSNWMRFVRLARTFDEQNILLHESADNRLHFRTCLPIAVHQELKVGYSPAYAKRYGLQSLHETVLPPPLSSPLVPPTTPPCSTLSSPSPALLCLPHKPPALAICDTWPCFECPHKCDTFSALQQHLTAAHDQITGINYPDRIARSLPQQRRRRQRRRMHRKVVADGGRTVRYACRHCAQVFSKYAALTRHCDRVHGGDLVAAGRDDVDDEDDEDDDDDDEEGGAGAAEDEVDGERSVAIVEAAAQEADIAATQTETQFGPHPPPNVVVDKPKNRSAPRFRCVYCAQPFHTAETLNAHVRPAHGTVDGRFVCPQCPQTFGTYVKVRQHLNSVHTDAVHACPECGHRFKKPHIMERHRRIHAADGGRHECAVCARRFQRSDKMLDHQRRMHPADERQRKRPGRPRRREAPEIAAPMVSEDVRTRVLEKDVSPPMALPQRSRRKPASTRRRLIADDDAAAPEPETAADLLLGLVELANGLDLMAPAPDIFVGMLPSLDACSDAMSSMVNVAEYFEQQQQQQQLQQQQQQQQMQPHDEEVHHHHQPSSESALPPDDEVAAYTAAQSLMANYCRSDADDRTDVLGAYYADELAERTQSTKDEPRRGNKNVMVSAATDHPFGCPACCMRFKRRGMLVNHMVRVHPAISVTAVPVLNEPMAVAELRRYACPYCWRVYGSHSKRRLHVAKEHVGCEQPLRLSQLQRNEGEGGAHQTTAEVVAVASMVPHPCAWCHKQYATRARLLRHQRVAHA